MTNASAAGLGPIAVKPKPEEVMAVFDQLPPVLRVAVANLAFDIDVLTVAERYRETRNGTRTAAEIKAFEQQALARAQRQKETC